MTTSNAVLAYKVLDHIDAHPEQHNQSDFVRRSTPAWLLSAEGIPCGTTACFAGWTVLLTGRTIYLGSTMPKVEIDGDLVEVDDVAARLLGLGHRGLDGDAHRLFYEARTREDLGRLVAEIFGPRPHPADSLFAPGVTLKDAPDPMYPEGEPDSVVDDQTPLCRDPHCPSVNVPHYGKPICPPEHVEAWRYDFPAARDTCGHDQVVMWSGVRWVHPMDMGVCDRPPASSDD